MKVLCVGSGAREHAIVRILAKNGATITAIMDKKNPGIIKLSKKVILTELKAPWDLKGIKADFCVIGPEGPLAEGLADYLQEKHEIPCIGPCKALARLETSKVFARSLLAKHNIPGNPPFTICSSSKDAMNFLQEYSEVAVKPDVLTGGKGVKVTGDHLKSKEEAIAYAEDRIASDKVVIIEQKLVGDEFTLQALWDGKTLTTMPLVQDFKRLLDGDKGPNTGSMGSYSRPDHELPFLSPTHINIAKSIMKKALLAAQKETNQIYRGILYGQFMLTSDGIYLIEFNCRYGDPEAMNVLSLLESNSLEIYQQMIDNSLNRASFRSEATVCIYLVPRGYPNNPEKGLPIKIPPQARDSVFYASVYEKDGTVYTTGSRALAVLGQAPSVPEARKKAYEMVTKFGEGLFHRTDIAAEID
ncbi:MAG: phosphoribosylamine--glycine ligase [Candidatus Hodarchaeota archaeon]